MVPEIKISKISSKPPPKIKAATIANERRKIAVEFVKASKELFTPKIFFNSTKFYSGSISPEVAKETDTWARSGTIPPEVSAEIYHPGVIADLSRVAIARAEEPKLETKFKGIYDENKKYIRQDDLYERVSEYQDALMRLACSSKMLQDTLSSMRESNTSWLETAKNNFKWIKETVTRSVARIYQAFGQIYDKVTKAIDNINTTLSKWSLNLKEKLIEKIRDLSQHFLELVNNLISALFGWLSRLREIAAEKGFRLNKVTVTIDPLSLTTVSVLGFSIPIPEIKLPKIEMEFT